MRNNHSKWTLLTLFAIVGVILYCSLTFVAIVHYPDFFHPLTDYLSKLGNSSLNPTGAFYYNLAVIFAGLLLIPTYLGLFAAYRRSDKNWILVSALIFGIINAVSIIMSGVFNEDLYTLHFLWSLLIFATWIPVLFLMNSILFKQGGIERGISLYGFGLALFNIIFVLYVLLIGTGSGSILEWIAVFTFQSWTILLTLQVIWRFRTRI